MAQRVNSLDSLIWYPFDALLDQISGLNDISMVVAIARITLHNLDKIGLSKVLISLQKLHCGHFTDFFKLYHLVTRWHAFDLSLLKDLKTFSITWEEWCASDELE